MGEQLDLFRPLPETRKDVIVQCSECGRDICVQGYSRIGFVMSEYRGAKGECWDCDKITNQSKRKNKK